MTSTPRLCIYDGRFENGIPQSTVIGVSAAFSDPEVEAIGHTLQKLGLIETFSKPYGADDHDVLIPRGADTLTFIEVEPPLPTAISPRKLAALGRSCVIKRILGEAHGLGEEMRVFDRRHSPAESDRRRTVDWSPLATWKSVKHSADNVSQHDQPIQEVQ